MVITAESATPDPRGGPRSSFRRSVEQHDAAAVRRWAWSCGMQVSRTGGLPRYVYELYEAQLSTVPAGETGVTLEGGPAAES